MIRRGIVGALPSAALPAAVLLAAVFLMAGFACGAAPETPPAAPSSHTPDDAPLEFRFPASGDDVVSSETTRGRATALVFITTYDISSQLVARRLGEVVVRFKPRSNAAAVVLEPPAYAELLPTYRETLALPYPVVMADFATQQRQGPFGDIQNVPTLVVLDRSGREVWRHQGALEARDIEAALKRASAR
jgi:hypothetical protein